VKILASLFRHGLFGLILSAPLRDRWHGVLEGHRKVGKLIIPIHRKGDGVNAPTTEASLSLASLEKYTPSAL